jgi:hypothetical protein
VTARRQRFQGDPVADAFDEDDRASVPVETAYDVVESSSSVTATSAASPTFSTTT